MKERNISIDLLKFIATFLILNSHMDILYVYFPSLATGGAIGDVVFFFCSGYMLFQKPMSSFDNWYGNRINRIYPTVFAWAIISSFCFDNHQDMMSVIMFGGGGFVSAIMLYYIFMYLINKYFIGKEIVTVLIVCCIISVCYYFFPNKYGVGRDGIYGDISNFRWVFYFLFILLGAYIGNGIIKVGRSRLKFDVFCLILSVLLFYGIQVIAKVYKVIAPFQIISLLPLIATTYYLYKLCSADFILNICQNKVVKNIVLMISSLTLEVYLVQFVLIRDTLNDLFPLNILIITITVFFTAYLLRCLSRVFTQTFKGNGYDWKQVFELI